MEKRITALDLFEGRGLILQCLHQGLWTLCGLQPAPKEKVCWWIEPTSGTLVIQWR